MADWMYVLGIVIPSIALGASLPYLVRAIGDRRLRKRARNQIWNKSYRPKHELVKSTGRTGKAVVRRGQVYRRK